MVEGGFTASHFPHKTYQETQIVVERKGESDGKNINQCARQGSYYRPPSSASIQKQP
jgi:hypothetical protein